MLSIPCGSLGVSNRTRFGGDGISTSNGSPLWQKGSTTRRFPLPKHSYSLPTLPERRGEGVRLATTQEATTTEPSSEVTQERKYVGKTAVVIGAGPAGAAAAGFLAKHGFTVKVFERRRDSSQVFYSEQRAHGIGLRSKSVEIARELGVQFPENGFRDDVHRLAGIAFATPDGLQAFNLERDPLSSSYVGQMNGLSKIIAADVAEAYADELSILYNHECKGVDFANRRVIIEDSVGETLEIGYDVLIGADGADSIVRDELMEADPSLTMKTYNHKYCFKVLPELMLLSSNEIMDGLRPGYTTYVRFAGKVGSSEGMQAPVLILCRSKSAVRGTFYAFRELCEEIDADPARWMQDHAPPGLPKIWVRQICKQWTKAPLSNVQSLRILSKFYGAQTVLVGDAVRDAKALDEALEQANGDVEAVGKLFHDLRFEEVRALQDFQTMHLYRGFSFGALDVWRAFAGWVHLSIIPMLERLTGKALGGKTVVELEADRMKFAEAVSKLKRDAFLFAGLLTIVAFLVVGGVACLASKVLSMRVAA